MKMPGMDMGSTAPGKTADVPGHGEVNLPGEIAQRIGVKVGRVEQGPLRMTVRAVGIVRPDETKVAHVHLKTEGWVKKLSVSYTGQKVKKGDALLSIYSPQFVTTQQEYLSARKSGQTELASLTRERLELWDVPSVVLDELDRTGRPQTNLTLPSPIDGTVLDKNVFEGQRVTPETDLYVVADLSTVWVQARIYEYELPHVQTGMPAKITASAIPDHVFAGKIVFIQPTLQEKTRTVEVRVELSNADGTLRPGMFSNVVMEHDMGQGLLVPATAVMQTGESDVAYRVVSAGRYVPVVVEVGPIQFGDRLQVLKGLKEGEQVVTSANFLIDSESRLRGGGMAGMAGMDMGDMKGMDMKSKDEKRMEKKGAMEGMKH
jgi:Cu(I)/Ag(I) efflux system membrane fusion protein